MRIEFSIKHTGREWMVENELFCIFAPTLEEIDHRLKCRLKDDGILGGGKTIEVLMAFDNGTLPQWIRQYAQHYFNRIVIMEG
jgi:hypothetical protein